MRGNPDIADGKVTHDGEWDGTDIHIDQDFLDNPANLPVELLALLLHEEAHKMGYSHSASEPLAGVGYVTYPFSHFVDHPISDANTCVPGSQ